MGNVILMGNAADELLLMNLNNELTGSYTCTADNIHGHIESEPAKVQLQCEYLNRDYENKSYKIKNWTQKLTFKITYSNITFIIWQSDNYVTLGWISMTLYGFFSYVVRLLPFYTFRVDDV